MAIPDAQLETWSAQGSVTQSADTYNAVRRVLESKDAAILGRSFDVYLQGSYGNHTNIFAESDVDLVVQLTETFYSNRAELTESEQVVHAQSFPAATYELSDFKTDVFNTLRAAYGSDVTLGTKAISIAASGSRRKADVIVATEYRKYSSFRGPHVSTYVEGIRFLDSAGREIINYPRVHSTNLTAKNQQTGAHFKPMVRVLKNMRTKLVSDGVIRAGLAPSYFVEGMLYNVPSRHFVYRKSDTLLNALNWLYSAEKDELVCANEQYYLLRDGLPVCWPRQDGEVFLAAAIGLWNNFR